MATRMDRASATTTMVARSRRRREQQREVRHAERQKGSVEKSLTARCRFRLLQILEYSLSVGKP